MTNNVELNDQCCCCQETLLNEANICILTCKHKFHLTCILKVRNNQCPLCRELLLPENELPPNDEDEDEDGSYDNENETDEYETITEEEDDCAMSIVEETIEELTDEEDESNEQSSFDDELKDRIHFVIIKTKKCINMLQDYYSTNGIFTKFCINEQQGDNDNETNEKQFIFNLNMLCECISKFICSYKFKYFDKMFYFVDYFCKIAELNKSPRIELFIEQITQLKSCYEYLEELLLVEIEVEMDVVEEEEKTNTD